MEISECPSFRYVSCSWLFGNAVTLIALGSVYPYYTLFIEFLKTSNVPTGMWMGK